MIRRFTSYKKTIMCYECGTISETIVNSKRTFKSKCPECDGYETKTNIEEYIRKRECERCKGGKLKTISNEEQVGQFITAEIGTYCKFCDNTGEVDFYKEPDRSIIEEMVESIFSDFE